MKKYDINSFFVGKLVMLFNYENLTLSELSKEEKNRQMGKFDIIMNGAIDLKNSVELNSNSSLSLFYKDKDNYYCLHNGKCYQTIDKSIDYCDNLISLKELLPKLDFYMPAEISMHEAINYFNCLFKNVGKFKYNNTEYNLDNFYYGETDLCISSKVDEKVKIHNLCLSNMLLRNNLNIGNYFKIVKQNDFKDVEYNYSIFKSIFFKFRYNEAYSVCDNQVYILNNPNNIEFQVKNLRPLKEELNNNDIIYNSQYVSIPKVLKYIKKIN